MQLLSYSSTTKVIKSKYIKMLRNLLVLTLLGLCCGQTDDLTEQQKQEELTQLLQEIFGNPSSTPAPTEAIPVSSVPVCYTAAGTEGQCMTPSNCLSGNSPDSKNFKGDCVQGAEVCCPLDDLSFTPVENSSVMKKTGCGWQNTDAFATRVLSDGETAFAEFPWMVAVLQLQALDESDPASKKVSLYTGGGTLIHPRVVMTAAHVVHNTNNTLRVRAGEWDTRSTDEIYPHQDRQVERMILHERFNRTRANLHYDIALLVLDKPLELQPNVNTLCLPSESRAPAPATRCFSAGWGKDKFGKGGSYQVIPKKVEVPVVDKSSCQEQLRTTRLGAFFKLHKSFLCAGGEVGKDTCKGDGGSALMCPVPVEVPVVDKSSCQEQLRTTRLGAFFKLHKSFLCAGGEVGKDTCKGDGGSALMCPVPEQSGRFMASGMVAWGLGCGETYPAVYADIAYLRPWVDAKMAALGFSTDSYTY
ncbi:unnamed protein product, partial [Iphiclides podalirius]